MILSLGRLEHYCSYKMLAVVLKLFLSLFGLFDDSDHSLTNQNGPLHL